MPPRAPAPAEVRRILEAFIGWLERTGPLSQDHHDLWVWGPGRRAKRLYHRHPRLGAAAIAPLALVDTFVPSTRALVTKPARFPIADAHYAMGLLALDPAVYEWRIRGHLDGLDQSRCAGWTECCWGYPFAWETCVGTWELGRPLITQTPYGYEAFAAAYEQWGEESHLAVLESVAMFAMNRIPSEDLGNGSSVCAYTPFDTRRVINANAYRAFLLADAGVRFGRTDWLEEGMRNIRFVLDMQQGDGSWLYAVDDYDAFIDNFHTCFVLKNLFKVWRLTGGEELWTAVSDGYRYYKSALLDDAGLPIPFAKPPRLTLFTRELYDFAEGLNLALLLREVDDDAGQIAGRLAQTLTDRWALPDGHFVTRETRLWRHTLPYHRWAQAQAFHALADFAVVTA